MDIHFNIENTCKSDYSKDIKRNTKTARNKRTGAITKTKKIQITGGIYDD